MYVKLDIYKKQKITFVTVSRTTIVGGAVIWPSNTKKKKTIISRFTTFTNVTLIHRFSLCTLCNLPLYISIPKWSLSLQPYPVLSFRIQSFPPILVPNVDNLSLSWDEGKVLCVTVLHITMCFTANPNIFLLLLAILWEVVWMRATKSCRETVELLLQSLITSELDWGEWSASIPGHFRPEETAPDNLWKGIWVDFRDGQDHMEKRNISCACWRPAPSWLHCPVTWVTLCDQCVGKVFLCFGDALSLTLHFSCRHTTLSDFG